MNIRTPTEAVEYAIHYLNKGYNGYCLAHVQDAYGATPVYASAIEAWNNSRYKHPTTDLASAPFGAPIYWSQPGNPYGHIAIHLEGDVMYTTDSGTGYPHTDSIQKWQNQYGYRPLGWTEDVENQLIPNLIAESEDDDMPNAQEVAQAVWGFVADKNPQPQINPYETLKTAAQTGGVAFTVNDAEHGNGNTVFWLNLSTFETTGFKSSAEWNTFAKTLHMLTSNYVKLSTNEWNALKTFLERAKRKTAENK